MARMAVRGPENKNKDMHRRERPHAPEGRPKNKDKNMPRRARPHAPEGRP